MAQTHITPNAEGLALLAKLPDDQAIQMVNFLKFRQKAEYPGGHENASKGWSGQEAYGEYGKTAAAPLGRAGAKIILQNRALATVIGPEDEAWNAVIVVEYPNAKAFLNMIAEPEYLSGAINRTAALADSRLFLTRSSKAA